MKKSKGFTLIELLVVIAIIAILTTVVLSSLNKARARARDTKRLADISQVQLALAAYLNKHGTYPTGNDITALAPLATEKFISVIPTDTLNSLPYKYGYTSAAGTSYCLSAELENPSSFIDSSITCTTDVSASTYSYRVTK